MDNGIFFARESIMWQRAKHFKDVAPVNLQSFVWAENVPNPAGDFASWHVLGPGVYRALQEDNGPVAEVVDVDLRIVSAAH